MSAIKIGQTTTKNFNLLFFIINLHFVTSNQIFTYTKLISLLTSLMTQTCQSWPHVFFLLCLRRNNPQTFKGTATKTLFSSVHVITKTCFDECFLFHVRTGRRYFLWKLIVTLRFFKSPCCSFLWSLCFEKSSSFMCYLIMRLQFLWCYFCDSSKVFLFNIIILYKLKALFVLQIFSFLLFFPLLPTLSRFKRANGSGIIYDVMKWLA